MSERWTETARKVAMGLSRSHVHTDVDSVGRRHVWLDSEPAEYQIAQALAAAYISGQQDMQRRAVEVVKRWSLPTIQTPSMWLVNKTGIASAIAALSVGGRDE